MLKISGLTVTVEGKVVLKNVSLVVDEGETVILMGPNGSGKSSLAYTLAGLPKYKATKGKVGLDGEDLLKLKPNERALKGLFLSWQNPVEIKGVRADQLLRRAAINCNNVACERVGQVDRCVTVAEFRQAVNLEAKKLKINNKLLNRGINVGFSGGEKKKMEMLQLVMLQPKVAVIDEIDSGLDVDSLRLVGERIGEFKEKNPKLGILLITHYQRILKFVKADKVLVMKQGRIVRSGKKDLLEQIEKRGYEGIK